MKSKKSKFLLGLTVAVLLPFSFFISAKLLKKDNLRLPAYYNIAAIKQGANGAKDQDTVYQKVTDISLINQVGDMVSINKDLAQKMLLIAVINQTKDSLGIETNMYLKNIMTKAFRKNDSILQLITISLNPEKDSTDVLKQFAQSLNVNPDKWWFLNGDGQQIRDFVQNELHLKLRRDTLSNIWYLDEEHPKLVLLDKKRFVRGYYNALSPVELKLCADDIGILFIQNKQQ